MADQEKKLQEVLHVEGKVISYHVDKVLCNQNKEARREYVTHPGGVCILAINEKRQIIMEKQFRYPFHKIIYELPAGKLEKGENPTLAAIRELEEETGYQAQSINSLGEMYPSVGYTNEIIYLFFTNDLKKTSTHFDEDEWIDIEWVDLEKVIQMIQENQIHDAKTICLIGKYMLLQKQL